MHGKEPPAFERDPMGLFRRTKSKTEKLLEGAETRAVALAKAQHEEQVQKERLEVFEARARAAKVRRRAEKLRRGPAGGPSRFGRIGTPEATDSIVAALQGTPTDGKRKKEENMFKL